MPKETRPTLVTAALLVGTFLSSMDVNVVGTSLPTVVSQLGGLELYGWVFAAYLLTSTTTLPLYGRLADIYGRKPMYLLAVALFLTGSVLCGLAETMIQLILFRALQGLGAGGLIPITLTLFGDMYQAERRALVQGIFSVVWGVSSVLGPLIGGALVTIASWHWVFWINLPMGLAAALVLLLSLHEDPARRDPDQRVNLPSALLLIVSLTCALVALQRLGEGSGADAGTAGLALAAALCGALQLLLERRSPSPMFPPEVFSHRAAVVTYLFGLATGSILFAVLAYIPLFVQGVLHDSPTQAGLALVPLSVTWTASTFAMGWLSRRLGYRTVIICGGALVLAGTATLLLLQASPSQALLYAAMAVIGLGMASMVTAPTLAVQDVMPWSSRAMATAMMQFTRSLGGTFTVTLLGLVVTDKLRQALPPGVDHPGELLDPGRWTSLPPEVLAQSSAALSAGLHLAFWITAGLALAGLLVTFGFPDLRMSASQSLSYTEHQDAQQ